MFPLTTEWASVAEALTGKKMADPLAVPPSPLAPTRFPVTLVWVSLTFPPATIPPPSAVGVPEAGIEELVDGAMGDGCTLVNPRELSEEDFTALYEAAI